RSRPQSVRSRFVRRRPSTRCADPRTCNCQSSAALTRLAPSGPASPRSIFSSSCARRGCRSPHTSCFSCSSSHLAAGQLDNLTTFFGFLLVFISLDRDFKIPILHFKFRQLGITDQLE